MIGMNSCDRKLPAAQPGTPRDRPITIGPSRLSPDIPSSTPFTRRFGPPHVLMSSPPATPPAAAIDSTVASEAALLAVRARIIGTAMTPPKAEKKLRAVKANCSPSRLGRARI